MSWTGSRYEIFFKRISFTLNMPALLVHVECLTFAHATLHRGLNLYFPVSSYVLNLYVMFKNVFPIFRSEFSKKQND